MAWYLEALRKYADFNGRARRTEYWAFVLINFLIILGGTFLADTLGFGGSLLGLYVLAMIIPSLAVTVRRLHDTNKSGWWLLLSFVPFGNLILLIFTLLDGDYGPNQYGNPPFRGTPNGRVDSRMQVIDPIEDEIIFADEKTKEKQFEMPSDDVFL